jgi:hypothetical protein
MLYKPTSEAGLFNRCSTNSNLLQQHNSVPAFAAMIDMNLVTPKGAAKHELLLNKSTAGPGLLHT